jgi:hypothetical protein
MSSIPVTRRYRPGLPVYLNFNEEDLNLFDPTTGERLSDGSNPLGSVADESRSKKKFEAQVTR